MRGNSTDVKDIFITTRKSSADEKEKYRKNAWLEQLVTQVMAREKRNIELASF